MTYIANVITTDNQAVLDQLLYPEQNPITQSYIYNQVANMSNTLNDIGRNWIGASKEIYNRINNSETIRQAKSILRSAAGINSLNEFSYYRTLEEVQLASPFMQNYIMAEPTIRALYHDQMCDGYSTTYEDVFPGVIGETHYHYRRVMDGIVVIDDETEEWVATSYLEDLIGTDRELYIEEQVNVLVSWEVVKHAIANRLDPSNPEGSNL